MILKRIKHFSDNYGDAAAIGGAAGIAGIAGVAELPSAVDAAKNKYRNYIKSGTPAPSVDYSKLKFSLGDIVSAERMGGLYSHYGVVTGFDKSGRPIITNYTNIGHLDPRKAAVLNSSLPEFAEGSKVHIERAKRKWTQEELQRRAADALQRGNGKYSIFGNNCEHFARTLANGEHTSTQVTNLFGKLVRKRFSAAPAMLVDLKNNIISKNLYNVRKSLTRDLGGMSRFNTYQTSILSAGGGALGGTIGAAVSTSKAKKKAKKYGLKKGTLEYDQYIKNSRRSGMLTGATAGAGLGFAGSKGADYVRGKVISDKARARGMDFGHDYLAFGKSTRGIRSDEDVNRIVKNWKEVGDYGKGVLEALKPDRGWYWGRTVAAQN